MNAPARFDHLISLTDHRGVFEHALHATPRREHGYCVDDVARALIVVVRDPDQGADLAGHADTYLRFLENAIGEDGLVRNRMDEHGEWSEEPRMGDWWGRLLWALGTAASHAPQPAVRLRARRAFSRAADRRPADLRTAVFAALGAVHIAYEHPTDAAAWRLVADLVRAVPSTGTAAWPWPEPRLTYANAAIAEALMVSGALLRDAPAVERGLELLTFLMSVETSNGRLSVTGSHGRGPGEEGPMFDQQPIEVAAIADACARAYTLTRDPRWREGVGLAWSWFIGVNDGNTVMIDHETGAGFDGLERDGRNENRGAESTIAALSTYQHARRLGMSSST
ncbi:glycosyltransferase [Microbacterium sp. VKM Ac-2870]|uniref:glycosyltransferase n=1 Tax=Microbacterium sp. VKM Ac-2870 TaxID=2783825 RepID=UPI00188CEA03|nr:glycosyltransferase [Microbacterium sp. VKM Ac-2870]MBF4562634.1 glycosyltransferase [Microbacterium sp. VKM Ac-2870]